MDDDVAATTVATVMVSMVTAVATMVYVTTKVATVTVAAVKGGPAPYHGTRS